MKLIRFPEVMDRVGLKRSAIYGLIKEAKFPAPLKQGSASFWVDDEIESYLEGLMSARGRSGGIPPATPCVPTGAAAVPTALDPSHHRSHR